MSPWCVHNLVQALERIQAPGSCTGAPPRPGLVRALRYRWHWPVAASQLSGPTGAQLPFTHEPARYISPVLLVHPLHLRALPVSGLGAIQSREHKRLVWAVVAPNAPALHGGDPTP